MWDEDIEYVDTIIYDRYEDRAFEFDILTKLSVPYGVRSVCYPSYNEVPTLFSLLPSSLITIKHAYIDKERSLDLTIPSNIKTLSFSDTCHFIDESSISSLLKDNKSITNLGFGFLNREVINAGDIPSTVKHLSINSF